MWHKQTVFPIDLQTPIPVFSYFCGKCTAKAADNRHRSWRWGPENQTTLSFTLLILALIFRAAAMPGTMLCLCLPTGSLVYMVQRRKKEMIHFPVSQELECTWYQQKASRWWMMPKTSSHRHFIWPPLTLNMWNWKSSPVDLAFLSSFFPSLFPVYLVLYHLFLYFILQTKCNSSSFKETGTPVNASFWQRSDKTSLRISPHSANKWAMPNTDPNAQ